MAADEPEIVPGPRDQAGEFIQRPAKLLRIASMIRELLEDVRQSAPDEAGRKRLRAIYDRALAELKDGLSEDLQQELETLTMPLDPAPSESEIRIAQAQLVGASAATISTSAWASPRATRRSARSASRGGWTTGPSAPSPTWRRGFAAKRSRGRSS
jgi:hypothetical protein